MEKRYLGPKGWGCVRTLQVCGRDSAKGGRGSSSVTEGSGAFGRTTKGTDSDTRTTTDEDSASSSAAIVIDHAFDGDISGERSTLHRRVQRKGGPKLSTLQPTEYSFQAHLMRKHLLHRGWTACQGQFTRPTGGKLRCSLNASAGCILGNSLASFSSKRNLQLHMKAWLWCRAQLLFQMPQSSNAAFLPLCFSTNPK